MIKRIDTENHFASEAWVDALRKNAGYPRLTDDPKLKYRMEPAPGSWLGYGLLDKLLDMDEGRLRRLDEAGIDVAVLSLAAPGTEPFEPGLGTRIARETNDALAEAIARHPDRYLGYATLAPKDADGACKELERCVKELGFRGWNTHSNFGDSFLDAEAPLAGAGQSRGAGRAGVPASQLAHHQGVPDLRHGARRPDVRLRRRDRPGGHAPHHRRRVRRLPQTADHARPLRRRPALYARPGGPPVPAGPRAPRPGVAPTLKRLPSAYLLDNFLASTSGNYSPAAFACTKTAIGAGRMVIGSDYPFEDMDSAPLPRRPADERRGAGAAVPGTATAIGMGL